IALASPPGLRRPVRTVVRLIAPSIGTVRLGVLANICVPAVRATEGHFGSTLPFRFGGERKPAVAAIQSRRRYSSRARNAGPCLRDLRPSLGRRDNARPDLPGAGALAVIGAICVRSAGLPQRRRVNVEGSAACGALASLTRTPPRICTSSRA